MTVDRDRQATYDAEAVAFADTVADEHLSFTQVRSLFEAITSSSSWAGLPVPRLRPTRRDATWSHAVGAEEVAISTAGQRAHVLVHELAHVVVVAWRCGGGHDESFRGAEVELSRVVFGSVVADRLADAFSRAGLAVGAVPGLGGGDDRLFLRWWAAEARNVLAGSGSGAERDPIVLPSAGCR